MEALVELAPVGRSIYNSSEMEGSDEMRPSLAFETSSDCGPSDMDEPFVPENGANAEVSSPQLYPFLRLLFMLQGGTMQLPSLSLLAIVNDRAAIPPAFLPAYSAIAFLPHSLKPLWATLSTIGADGTSKECHVQKLLGILLAANGLTYLGTALWIPVGGVVQCFVWGFLRGVTDAWAQFLTDQLLILQAQDDSDSAGSKSHISNAPGDRSYQAVSSIFQSHAATYSSGGSLIASVFTFAVMAWRQVHKVDNGTDPPLSASVVFAFLLASACACFVGAAVVFHQVQVGKSTLPEDHNHNGRAATFTSHSDSNCQQQNRGLLFATGSVFSTKYDALPSRDDAIQGNSPVGNIESPSTTAKSTTQRIAHDSNQEWVQEGGRSTTTFRDKSDVACLILLQLLLVGGAIKGPVDSLDAGPAIWTAIMIVLATCFVGAAFVSSCLQQGHQQHESVGQRTTMPKGRDHASTIPPRRLGLYLLLRHSVPIAGILMFSYTYAIFGKEEPVFLQCLFMIESVVSVLANWTFARFLAESFHSGWRVLALIAILSVVTSLVSLLDVIVVHVASAKDEIDASLRWLVAAVSVASFFMGQIGYMPSIILATANVVSVPKDTNKNVAESSSRESIPSSEGRRSDDDIDANVDQWHGDTAYDEGIQYATFVACIDFGAQMGDWISVPIIAALGIERENHWANLDKFIVLCAMLRIASVAFLYIIRPVRQSSTMMTMETEIIAH